MEVVFNEPNTQCNLPIVAKASYLSTKSELFGWFISPLFILPFFLDKRSIFKRLVFSGDIFPLTEENSIEEQRLFLNEMVELCHQKKLCDFISKAQSNVLFNTFPDQSVHVPWGTHEVPLDKNDEELLASFHNHHKKVIRKAVKDGVSVTVTHDPLIIYENIKETLVRQHLPYYPSLDYLTSLQANCPENVRFYVSMLNGELQGCAVIVLDHDRAYAMYAGSIPKPSSGSLNLMHYTIMTQMRDLGIPVYDFTGARINVKEGSKYEGIQTFKLRFGAQLREGYAFRVVINPIRYFLFNLSAKLYLALKGQKYTDTIDQIRFNEYD